MKRGMRGGWRGGEFRGDSDDAKGGFEVVGEHEDGECEEDETDFSSGRRGGPVSR